jgi:bla regulator protein BlaR1
MELYILKSSACLFILFSFYKFFLEKESIHIFKRFYLLGSLVVSTIIPCITFISYVKASEVLPNAFIIENSNVIASETEVTTNYLSPILWSLYGIGAAIFSFKFFRNIASLIVKIRYNPKLKLNNITNVLLSQAVTPHTFFSYIFLNKQRFESNEIPPEVLLHEKIHAIQKHSIDVLLIELVQVVFWFNPLIYMLKHAMKLNHEFLADQAVINNGIATTYYQNLLLEFSSNPSPQLANSINYSSIKKRITVMKTETSKRSTLLRTLVLLPLLAILILGFSSREVIHKEAPLPTLISNPDQASTKQLEDYNKMASLWNQQFTSTNKRIIPLTELNKLETIYRKMSSEQKSEAQPFPKCDPPRQVSQDKASPEQVNEYNKLARKYNTMDNENLFIRKNDVERLRYLYALMSYEQRKNAEPFPNFPPPPKAPELPESPEKPEYPEVPKSVKVIKGVSDKYPNIPPPPKAPKAPKSIKVIKGVNNMDLDVPPPPPAMSEDPLDHIVRMANENAAFFYEGKRISSDKAIAIFKKNKNLTIETEKFKNSNPIVKITKAVVKIKK